MRKGKKPLGMKHKIREERKREERISLILKVGILIIIIFISGILINSMRNQPSTNQTISSTSEPKAAIVDQLNLTYPNETFMATATNTLEQAGYTVDYYKGEEVTVELYRNLPTHNYGLIILRVHSTYIHTPYQSIYLFTSEPYSQVKYVYEQLSDQLTRAQLVEEGPAYFAISPDFVKSCANGKFQNTIIVEMGCDGLRYPIMADAFIKRGAKAYLSWNGSVSASHTDLATTRLLQHLLTEKRTIREAVEETMKEVGPDPCDNSVLLYHPHETQNYTIPNIVDNFVTSSVEIQHKARAFHYSFKLSRNSMNFSRSPRQL